MIELLGMAGLIAASVFAVWLVDHWRGHSTAICHWCKQLRRVDRENRCYHCYEHGGSCL